MPPPRAPNGHTVPTCMYITASESGIDLIYSCIRVWRSHSRDTNPNMSSGAGQLSQLVPPSPWRRSTVGQLQVHVKNAFSNSETRKRRMKGGDVRNSKKAQRVQSQTCESFLLIYSLIFCRHMLLWQDLSDMQVTQAAACRLYGIHTVSMSKLKSDVPIKNQQANSWHSQ